MIEVSVALLLLLAKYIALYHHPSKAEAAGGTGAGGAGAALSLQ